MFTTALCLLYETTVKSGFTTAALGGGEGTAGSPSASFLVCLISYSNTDTNKKREQRLAGKSVCLTGRAINPSH